MFAPVREALTAGFSKVLSANDEKTFLDYIVYAEDNIDLCMRLRDVATEKLAEIRQAKLDGLETFKQAAYRLEAGQGIATCVADFVKEAKRCIRRDLDWAAKITCCRVKVRLNEVPGIITGFGREGIRTFTLDGPPATTKFFYWDRVSDDGPRGLKAAADSALHAAIQRTPMEVFRAACPFSRMETEYDGTRADGCLVTMDVEMHVLVRCV
jgi:hypothetical protein